MAITAAQVNELRQKTGAGMMDCKKALTEADGDIQKAIEILRKKGAAVAAKRAEKSANEGVVLAQISDDKHYEKDNDRHQNYGSTGGQVEMIADQQSEDHRHDTEDYRQ